MRTDVRYLVKGGGVMIMGQIGIAIVAVCSSIAFANLLSKSDFGVYQYILATIEFFLVFTLTGTGRALIVSIARGYDGSFLKAWVRSTIFGILAAIMGVLVGLYYIINDNFILGIGIGLGTPAMLLITNFKYYIPFLNGKKFFKLTSAFTFLNIFVTACGVITTLFVTNNILIILAVFLLINLTVNAILFQYSKRYIENSDIDKTLMPRTLHLSAQGMIGHLTSQADRILLFQFTGPVALAEYWLAQNVQRQFSHLFKGAKAVVLPKISTRSVTKLRATLMRKVLFLFAIIIPFTITYVLAIPLIFSLIFPAYTDAILFAQIFGILFLFLPFKVLGDVFIGHDMNNILYKITVLSSSLRLITTLALVPFFGIWGVVVSSTLDQFVYTVIVIWYFYKLK